VRMLLHVRMLMMMAMRSRRSKGRAQAMGRDPQGVGWQRWILAGGGPPVQAAGAA